MLDIAARILALYAPLNLLAMPPLLLLASTVTAPPSGHRIVRPSAAHLLSSSANDACQLARF
jgi:hypothetical protein